MLIPRAQACSMLNSASPLPAGMVDASRALAGAVQSAKDRAQAAVNSILSRSPADYPATQGYGSAVRADVAVSNNQNQLPGYVLPGMAVPSPYQFLSRLRIPGWMSRPGGAANRGSWGGAGAPSFRAGTPSRAAVPQWPDGSSALASPGSTPPIATADARLAPSLRFNMTTGFLSGPNGWPIGGVDNAKPGNSGDGGVPGFMGRGEVCQSEAAPIDMSVVAGPPNPPAPRLTLQDTSAVTDNVGLGGAYPVSATCANAAAEPDSSGQSVGQAKTLGISPWWWLALAGAVVLAAGSSGGSTGAKRGRTRTRRAA